jgi:hypothetical protein
VADDLDPAAVGGDDAVADREPDPGARALGLGSEEGSKTRRTTSGGIPGPLSSTSTTTARPPSSDRAGADREPSRRRHLEQRLLRVNDEVDEHLVELVGVAAGRRQAGRQVRLDRDARAAQAVGRELQRRLGRAGESTGPKEGGRRRAMARKVLTMRAQRSAARGRARRARGWRRPGARSRSISA